MSYHCIYSVAVSNNKRCRIFNVTDFFLLSSSHSKAGWQVFSSGFQEQPTIGACKWLISGHSSWFVWSGFQMDYFGYSFYFNPTGDTNAYKHQLENIYIYFLVLQSIL